MSDVSAYLTEMRFYYCWQLRDNIVVGKRAGFCSVWHINIITLGKISGTRFLLLGDDTWALRIGLLIPGCICRAGSVGKKLKRKKKITWFVNWVGLAWKTLRDTNGSLQHIFIILTFKQSWGDPRKRVVNGVCRKNMSRYERMREIMMDYGLSF